MAAGRIGADNRKPGSPPPYPKAPMPAVRNKLIHWVFAVIKDERNYEDNYGKNCAYPQKIIKKIAW